MPTSRRVGFRLELEWSYKHHSAMFAGTQRYAQEHGWETLVDEYAEDTLARCSAGSVPFDGVIARATKPLAEQVRRLGIPLVNVWYGSPVARDLPGVFGDCVALGRLQAEHLLSRGLRRFAALVSRNNRWQETSFEVFREVVAKAGCPCLMRRVPLHYSATCQNWRQTERILVEWMDLWEPPIGVVVGVETISRTIVQMCRHRGWRIPADVAILAGRNEEVTCEYCRPKLSSIEVGYDRVGYVAAELLDKLMNERDADRTKGSRKKRSEAPPHIILPLQGLVARESTDFFAVDDPVIAAALAFIARDSHRPIQVQDVAKAVTMEPRTLQRRFRKQLERTIADEIRRVRIERAKRELVQSDMAIAEVARAVGFEDGHRLYEVFMREVGITPSQYREERKRTGQR